MTIDRLRNENIIDLKTIQLMEITENTDSLLIKFLNKIIKFRNSLKDLITDKVYTKYNRFINYIYLNYEYESVEKITVPENVPYLNKYLKYISLKKSMLKY